MPAWEGWPHACYLHAEVAGHGQAPCRGGRPWLGYLHGTVARRGSSPTANIGGGVDRRGGRPLVGWLPAVKGSHRLRRGSGGGCVVRVK
ncbi:hypothetical protein BHE74_00020974 [Ensete ventricosum]|nr:hypothetical protein GW17_00039534 [Ensete ventricosum]RWW71289.1 hypothetical protein BHE74_00020974 [Ensete ventricosum]